QEPGEHQPHDRLRGQRWLRLQADDHRQLPAHDRRLGVRAGRRPQGPEQDFGHAVHAIRRVDHVLLRARRPPGGPTSTILPELIGRLRVPFPASWGRGNVALTSRPGTTRQTSNFGIARRPNDRYRTKSPLWRSAGFARPATPVVTRSEGMLRETES